MMTTMMNFVTYLMGESQKELADSRVRWAGENPVLCIIRMVILLGLTNRQPSLRFEFVWSYSY